MTNKDKFIEVFGFEPDTETMIPVCPPRGVECPFMDDGIYSECHCELWWGREYKALKQEQYYKDLAESYEKTINKLTKAIAEQEPTIKALGEELRKARKGIADEKVLIGYNMAVAICNKHLGESEGI